MLKGSIEIDLLSIFGNVQDSMGIETVFFERKDLALFLSITSIITAIAAIIPPRSLGVRYFLRESRSLVL
jgi:hypothetical protein